jgi:hypothetical protein
MLGERRTQRLRGGKTGGSRVGSCHTAAVEIFDAARRICMKRNLHA